MSPSSDIVDLEDYQEVPPTEATYEPELPFPFMDLDAIIRQRILRLLLVRQDLIAPYYNCCSLMAPAHLVEQENVDLGVLCVCKTLTAEASSILYGENMFFFKEPAIALWWLERIGSDRSGSNVFKIRGVAFKFNTGDTEPFNTLKETLWLLVVKWLARVQRLDEIWLSFSQWHTFDWSDFRCMSDFERELAARTRDRIIGHLQRYRGLKTVSITRGWTLGQMECDELISHMTSPKALIPST